MTDSLAIFERFFKPDYGYVSSLLEHQEENRDLWRIDLNSPEQCEKDKNWCYLFWSGSLTSYAKECAYLKRSEVRGFIRAKYPNFDVETAIKTAVTNHLQRLIRELE